MPNDFFVLRKEHDDAFAAAGVARFEKRCIKWLLRDFPMHEALIASDEFSSLLDLWIQEVRHFGIRTEKQMYTFSVSALRLLLTANDIFSNREIANILRSGSQPAQKIVQIEEAVRRLTSGTRF